MKVVIVILLFAVVWKRNTWNTSLDDDIIHDITYKDISENNNDVLNREGNLRVNSP